MLEIEREIVFCYLRCWQEKSVVRWFYWSAQTIRVVSQIYREQNNRRDVIQSENTDDTITDKTDWTIPILLSLIGLFVVVIWNGKGKYIWMKLLLAFSLNWNFFLKKQNKRERNGILIIDAGIPIFINSDIYIDLSYLCDIYYI